MALVYCCLRFNKSIFISVSICLHLNISSIKKITWRWTRKFGLKFTLILALIHVCMYIDFTPSFIHPILPSFARDDCCQFDVVDFVVRHRLSGTAHSSAPEGYLPRHHCKPRLDEGVSSREQHLSYF